MFCLDFDHVGTVTSRIEIYRVSATLKFQYFIEIYVLYIYMYIAFFYEESSLGNICFKMLAI